MKNSFNLQYCHHILDSPEFPELMNELRQATGKSGNWNELVTLRSKDQAGVVYGVLLRWGARRELNHLRPMIFMAFRSKYAEPLIPQLLDLLEVEKDDTSFVMLQRTISMIVTSSSAAEVLERVKRAVVLAEGQELLKKLFRLQVTREALKNWLPQCILESPIQGCFFSARVALTTPGLMSPEIEAAIRKRLAEPEVLAYTKQIFTRLLLKASGTKLERPAGLKMTGPKKMVVPEVWSFEADVDELGAQIAQFCEQHAAVVPDLSGVVEYLTLSKRKEFWLPIEATPQGFVAHLLKEDEDTLTGRLFAVAP